MLRIGHIAIAGWVLLGAAGACQRWAPPPTMDDVRAENEPDQESWGVHFYVTDVPFDVDESRMRLEIVADYMALYEREDSTYRLLRSHPDSLDRRVVAFLFDDRGDSSATLTADRVYYYEQDKRFEAEGNVVVVARDKKRLESEHLVWFEEERKVRTPGFVRIIKPKEQVQGYGLVADEDLASYQLGRITALVTVEDEE